MNRPLLVENTISLGISANYTSGNKDTCVNKVSKQAKSYDLSSQNPPSLIYSALFPKSLYIYTCSMGLEFLQGRRDKRKLSWWYKVVTCPF